MVDNEPFDLVEHGEMSRVRSVLAVRPARRDGVDRQHASLEEPDLNRRCVRAQENAPWLTEVDVERVDRTSSRMILGDVESLEVPPPGLDFGPLGDLVPHADEDVFEGLTNLGDEMQMPGQAPGQH